MGFKVDELKILNTGSDLSVQPSNNSGALHTEISIDSNGVTAQAKQQFCEQFNITSEQLENLLIQHPDLFSKSVKNVQDIINREILSETLPIQSESVQNSDIEMSDNNGASNTQFNHRAFEQLSTEDKFATYAVELAKNKFLYGQDSKHTVDEWNKLPEQEKQQLINTEVTNLKHDHSNTCQTDTKLVDLYFRAKMVKLQAANMLEMNVDSFNHLDADRVEEHVHSYLFGLDDENKTDQQIQNLERNDNFSQILINACKEKGLTKYEHLWSGQATYNLEPAEIRQMLSDLGTTRVQLTKDTLQRKIDNGTATEAEQTQYQIVSELVGVEKKAKEENVNKGVLDRLRNNPEYSQGWIGCTDNEDKIYFVLDYLKDMSVNCATDAERAELFDGMVNDLVLAGETEVANAVKFALILNANPELQRAMASHKGTGADALLTARSAGAFGENEEALCALEETHRSFAADDVEFGNRLACMTMDHASNKQNDYLSGLYADKERWGEPVQQKVVDLAYACDDAESQCTRLTNVNEKSSTTVKINAGTRIHEAFNENQAPLGLQFMKTKEVANAMNEAGTLTKCCTEAQQPLFTGFKNRFECDDYTKDEAVNQLNVLSDQIQYCDKDNQLAMHNEIMGSKYSEVQEHAAGNIKNYDPSVQPDAMSSVYKTGNQKAIETAIASIPEFKSPDVQQIVLKQAVMELVDKEAFADILAKLGGTLTSEQIAHLSPSERREYFTKLFDKANFSDQVAMLKNILHGNSGIKSKVTVYNLIGKFYPNLFEELVKDSGVAEKVYNMQGLDPKLKNKTVEVIVNSFDSRMKALAQELHLTNDDDYQQTANTVNYSSVPKDFNNETYDLFKKHGNLFA